MKFSKILQRVPALFIFLLMMESAIANPISPSASSVRVPSDSLRNLQNVVAKQVCDQYRDDFREKVFPKKDISRSSAQSFLNYYFVDCFDEPYTLNTPACLQSRKELVEPLASYGWKYFSGRCELVPSSDGNANGDRLYCGDYIDKLLSGEVSEPKINLEALAKKQDISGLVASYILAESKDPSAAVAGMLEILGDFRQDCYCGNGRVDFSEECDPGISGKSCGSDCKLLTIRSVDLIRLSPKVQTVEGLKGLFPLMADD